jgi:hypothetical protein
MREVSGDVVYQGRIGEERGRGRVIGFTDGMDIMPGHGNRQVECSIWQMVPYDVKECGKPTV